jgi:hypothetical protein
MSSLLVLWASGKQGLSEFSLAVASSSTGGGAGAGASVSSAEDDVAPPTPHDAPIPAPFRGRSDTSSSADVAANPVSDKISNVAATSAWEQA